MDPHVPDDEAMDEDMELQLALALSLQETTAADLGSGAGTNTAQQPGTAGPSSAGAAAPGMPDLATLLLQGLQAAQQPAPPPPAASAPPAPAPAPHPLPPTAQPAAGPPAPPPAAAAAGAPPDNLLAALLQQFFAGGMPAGGPAPQQPQPHPNQGQLLPTGAAVAAAPATSGSSRAAAARNPPPPEATPLPGWAVKLRSWWCSSSSSSTNNSNPGAAAAAGAGAGAAPTSNSSGSSGSVTLAGQEQLGAVCGRLGDALQVKVVSESAAISGGALFLKTSAAPGGGRELSSESFRGLINSALLQRRVAPRDRLQALHRAFASLPSSASPPPGDGGSGSGGVCAALDLFRRLLAREAFGLLREDGADLYFDTGAHTAAFVEALAGGPATLSDAFLEALLDASSSTTSSSSTSSAPTSTQEVWGRLVREVLRAVCAPAARLTDAGGFERPLAVLDRLTCTPRLQQCMASLLLADVEAVARCRPATQAARALEQSCVLGPLLGASPMPSGQDALYHLKTVSPARTAFLEIRNYPRYVDGASARTVLQGMMARVQDGAGHLMARLSRTKDGGLSREALLSWVAAVGRANTVRGAFGETSDMRLQQDLADFVAGGSDGFLLNVTGGCLRLAEPFTSGWLAIYRSGADPFAAAAAAAAGGAALPRFADLFEKHLRPEYYRTQRHRLGDLSGVFNVTGSRGSGGFTADDDPPAAGPPMLLQSDAVGGEGAPSFMADVFFLTQLLLHVGPMQSVFRRRAMTKRFQDRYRRAAAAAGGSGGDGGGEDGDEEGDMGEGGPPSAAGGGLRNPYDAPVMLEWRLYEDCCDAHLWEPVFADNMTAFAVMELDWVAWLARGGAGAPAAPLLRLVPEFALGDAVDWLVAVLYAGRADLVAAKPIGVILRAVVTLLNAKDVVRSAVLQDKLVGLLLAMLASQLSNVQARQARGLALAPDRMSTGERALVGAVLGAPVTQRHLIPALLRAHVNAELVVGLDVDKDSYDKYNMRNKIDIILDELIKDAVLKRCLVELAAANEPQQPQPSTANGGAAGSNSAAAAAATAAATATAAAASSSGSSSSSDIEPGLFSDYASGIVNTVMHFFKDGLDRLADIYSIERSKADSAAWAAQPAEERQRKEDFYRGQQRAAGGFLRMGASNLRWLITLTADPSIASAFLHEPLRGKTAFLLVSSLELLLGDACKKLQVARPEQYGFDLPALVGAVLSLLLQLGRYDRFVAALMAEPDYSEEIMSRALAHLEATHQAQMEAQLRALLARAADIRAKRAAAVAAGGAAAAAGGVPVSPSAQPPLKRRKSAEGADAMEVDGGSGAGPSAEGPLLACEAVQLPEETLKPDEVPAAYREQLGPLSVSEYDSTVPGGYFKEMSRLADQDSGSSRKKARQLARELADMQPGGKLALPCAADAAIFLRQDAARMDKMRAVITGPQGTPYEGGLFVFDIFCPAGYPSDPPVMMVYNTGGGKARYNPNLYADGKVCLSLLGTYNSGHASEKWNPALSTIYQVLMSVQSQILVDDPMTNEPLSETLAGTAEGAAKTAEYNARLQLLVMRHAMVDPLLHPPPGTADIVTAHFRLLRGRLAERVRAWVRAAPSEELRAKLDEQAARLLELLAKL